MRVGMVLLKIITEKEVTCFPHACGDGPEFVTAVNKAVKFSPCVWGWSVYYERTGTGEQVFPMRVGMVRNVKAGELVSLRFPHACGDGPDFFPEFSGSHAFSPCVWGWSVHQEYLHHCQFVFPMRVGMVRFVFKIKFLGLSFPHACGDGPGVISFSVCQKKFSPCVWGWSVNSTNSLFKRVVFPMRVGMVRG